MMEVTQNLRDLLTYKFTGQMFTLLFMDEAMITTNF